MEIINYMDPPNRPMNTAFKPSQGPTLHKDLLFIDVDENETILVGSADVTATFWEGSLQTFKDFKSYQERSWLSYYNGCILNDGKLLPEFNSMILSESPYNLKILSIPKEAGDEDALWKDIVEHVEKIRGISLWTNHSRALTQGDKYLTIWDISDSGLTKITNFKDYHTGDLTSACTKKSDTEIFASTSVDRRLCVWDSRMEIAATEIYTNEFCSLTSVAWHPTIPNLVIAGSESGDLYQIDIAQPKEFLNVERCFQASIHKMEFNDQQQLAVCGDCPQLLVYNCNNSGFQQIFNGGSYEKFVRGLAWRNDCLYTCGFDSRIDRFNISEMDK